MNKLFQKILLSTALTIYLNLSLYSEYNVIIFLIITSLSISSFLINFKYYQIIYFCLSIILITTNNIYAFYIPIFIFDFHFNKKLILTIPIYFLVLFNTNLTFLFKITVLFYSSFTLILKYYLNKISQLQINLDKKRDYIIDLETKLVSQKLQLINNQDNEIQIATLKERGRIARDIHDNVGQILSSSIIQIGALKKINDNNNLNSMLNLLDSSLKNGMNSIRSSVHDIYAQSLNLDAELKKIVQNYYFCPIYLNYDNNENRPIKVKYAILAIINEALSNCAKHSNATLVKIIIKDIAIYHQLIIIDNGSVFDKKNNEGIGLKSIQERVEQLNGDIYFKSNNGFKIYINFLKGETK